jgi:hypothetical protein
MSAMLNTKTLHSWQCRSRVERQWVSDCSIITHYIILCIDTYTHISTHFPPTETQASQADRSSLFIYTLQKSGSKFSIHTSSFRLVAKKRISPSLRTDCLFDSRAAFGCISTDGHGERTVVLNQTQPVLRYACASQKALA